MPNLAAQMADHVNNILLNTGHGATQMTHTPRGGGDPVSFTGYFHEDSSAGDQQEDNSGRRRMRQAIVDVPVSVTVDEHGTFTVDGTVWQINGMEGTDDLLNSYSVIRTAHEQVARNGRQAL